MPYRYKILLTLVLVSSFSIPSILATNYIPIGEGPDEIAHIDYTFLKLANADQPISLARGILEPGFAPVGQGHQPPLSYWLGAKVLGMTIAPQDVGTFVDFQAGLAYSSEGVHFGGKDQCSYRIEQNRRDPETLRFRYSMYSLRILNALLLTISVFLTYLTGRLFFGAQHVMPLCGALLHASIPTALYRSVFVSNDNLVSAICSLLFFLSAAVMTKAVRANVLTALGVGFVAGLAFLSKYSGIVGLGIIGIGFLLRPGLVAGQRVKLLAALLTCFACTIAADLYENYSLDGDLLSTTLIIRVVPFLYSPNTLWEVLTNVDFSTTVLERFWINFHALSPSIGDLDFPFWTFDVFWALLGISVLGAIASACASHPQRPQYSLIYVLAAATFAGSLFAIIHFATSFPLPGGRYLHVAVSAFSVFVPLGIYSGIELAAGTNIARKVSASLFFILWIASQTMTFVYLGNRYEDCFDKTDGNVSAGIAVASGDITRDGVDELFLFHRIKNTVYVAQRDARTNMFAIVPSWTRTVGLVADSLFVDDLNGDGVDDLVFWRPFASLWMYVDGKSVAEHDVARSPYPELSAKSGYIPTKRTMPTEAMVADLDGDSTADLVTYHKQLGTTLIERPVKNRNVFRRDPGRRIKLDMDAQGSPFPLAAPFGAVGLASSSDSVTLRQLPAKKRVFLGDFKELEGATIRTYVAEQSEARLLSIKKGLSCAWELSSDRLRKLFCLSTKTSQVLFGRDANGKAQQLVVSSHKGAINEVHEKGEKLETVFDGF